MALETRFRRRWLMLTMGIYVGGVLVARTRVSPTPSRRLHARMMELERTLTPPR